VESYLGMGFSEIIFKSEELHGVCVCVCVCGGVRGAGRLKRV
jgi:hypothetical protein